jgi:chromosome segregation ATPase
LRAQEFSQNLTQEQEADLKRLTTESNKLSKQRADKHNALEKARRERTLLEEDVETKEQELQSLVSELESAQGGGREELEMCERRLKVWACSCAGCSCVCVTHQPAAVVLERLWD